MHYKLSFIGSALENYYGFQITAWRGEHYATQPRKYKLTLAQYRRLLKQLRNDPRYEEWKSMTRNSYHFERKTGL